MVVVLALLCASFSAPHRVMAATFVPHATSFRIAPDIEIVSVAFGRFLKSPQGVRFAPTRSMKMRPGDGYGWRVRVRTPRARVKMEEVLMLPTPPRSWGISSAVRLWRDQRGATTTLMVDANSGVLENWWMFSEGDPTGKYTMHVRIEGVEVGHVVFEVL